MTEGSSGHIQSLILSALLMGTGFFLAVVGLLADLISVNRKLLEGLDWRLQKMEEAGYNKARRDPAGHTADLDRTSDSGWTR